MIRFWNLHTFFSVCKRIFFCISHVTLPGDGVEVMTHATDNHEGEGGLKVA